MNLKQYLSNFSSKQLALIGPMHVNEFKNEEPIIFVDGGSKYYKGIGFKVGDGDSSSLEMDELLPRQKNLSDLAYVLSNIPSNIKEIKAFGFLNGRKDHELINFGEFFYFLDNRDCVIHLSNSLSLYSASKLDFDFNGEFSVINARAGKMTISGNCKYNFDGLAKFAYSSQFLSNIAEGEFQIESEMPYGLCKN